MEPQGFHIFLQVLCLDVCRMELGIYSPYKRRLSVLKSSQIFNHLILFLQVLDKKIYFLSFLAMVLRCVIMLP